MLLLASSKNEIVPEELSEEAMAFFAQTSILNAQVYLNSYLENMKVEVSVSAAVTTNLHLGCFLWANNFSPAGLASSILSDRDVTRPDILHEGIVLDYSTKHEMTKSSLDKLTKSQIMFPKSLEMMVERIKALHALSKLFFGELSYPEQGLRKLYNLCDSNREVMRAKLYLDDMFIAKFLYMVDDRLYQWLAQCCKVQAVEDTNLDLMNFAQLFYDVQANRFVCLLPPSVKKMKTNLKRKQGERVENESPLSTWKLRHDEKWDVLFKGKTGAGPALSMNCKPCLKYHVKGLCYEDCVHKESHCKLVGDDKVKTDNYIKELRGE